MRKWVPHRTARGFRTAPVGGGRKPILRWIGLSAIVVVSGACSVLEPEPAQIPVPTLSAPALPTSQGMPLPQPVPPQQPTDLRVQYPLTLLEAQQHAQAGFPVAGRLGESVEVVVRPTFSTVWETKQTNEQVCKYEYDYLQERDVYKCNYEYVDKRVPVTKTRYMVSGNGIATVERDTVAGAFSQIAPTDYWRKLA